MTEVSAGIGGASATVTEGGDHAGQFRNFSAKDGSHGVQDVSEAYAKESIELIQAKAVEIGHLRNDIQKYLSTAT